SACQEWPRPPTAIYRAPTPSPAPRRFLLRVGLPAEPNIDLLPLLGLADSEAVSKRSFDLRLVWSQGGQDALSTLLSGRSELALLDLPTAARAVEAKIDLVGVFQLYPRDPTAVFSLARSGLRQAAELRLKRVGLSS